MQVLLKYNNQNYQVDLSNYHDISIPFGNTKKGVRAWYMKSPEINPVKDGDFVGEVSQGSSVNFRNIEFNPHAHITHTECMGHISKTIHSVNTHLKEYYFITEVVSVNPQVVDGDSVITKKQLETALNGRQPKAIVIRTLPNREEKKQMNYSHTNPTYLQEQAAGWLNEIGVEHLLIDLPSVDKEKDDGELRAHKAFWSYPETKRLHCTITEFIFVPNQVQDGIYFMNLQTAPFENDATPSRPILHKMTKKN